jgi:hypothetical protein
VDRCGLDLDQGFKNRFGPKNRSAPISLKTMEIRKLVGFWYKVQFLKFGKEKWFIERFSPVTIFSSENRFRLNPNPSNQNRASDPISKSQSNYRRLNSAHSKEYLPQFVHQPSTETLALNLLVTASILEFPNLNNPTTCSRRSCHTRLAQARCRSSSDPSLHHSRSTNRLYSAVSRDHDD